MLSFHNNPAVKQKYLKRVADHAAADRLVQGTGWDGSRGCAIGCTLEAYSHERYPIELGLPEWLARLEDKIFEGLPTSAALTWPQRFLEAIPVGVDVEPVKWRLAIWRHKRQLAALADSPEPYAEQVRHALRGVIDYCGNQLEGDVAARSAESAESARSAAWSAARSAAESAARSAAESAAWSAATSAESAAWSAAESAWSAAESAARSAAESAWSAAESAESAESARSAAWSAAWSAESDELLRLLSDAGPMA